MNDPHPEDLLAAYVDGELSATDRRLVEAHAASCAVCTQELALARRALAALGALEDVPAPAGLATPAIQLARPEARWVRRVGWAAAGTAAAAVIVLFAVTQTRGIAPAGDEAGQADGPAEVFGDDGAGPEAPRSALFLETDEDYTSEEVGDFVRRNSDNEQALISTSEGDSDTKAYALDSQQAKAAIECIDQAGLRGDETTTLLRIEAARFEGKPAYIVLFRRGGDTLEVWVVDRRTCGILHVASSS